MGVRPPRTANSDENAGMPEECGDLSLHVFADGTGLTQVLADGAAFGWLERRAVDAETLDALAHEAKRMDGLLSPPPAALRQLGEAVRDRVLAPGIVQRLRDAGHVTVRLVVPAELGAIPWELGLEWIAQAPARLLVQRSTLTTVVGGGRPAVPSPIPALLAVAAPAQQADNQRQVTILQYDLVNSTRMLSAMGSEAYTETVNRMHVTCAQVVRDWGGMASNPQGSDGVMCYFGLPVAQEAAAANALRAALEIVERMEQLALQVRVGVVSGPVVVNAGQAYGVSIHLAARLQSVAAPGTVAVADMTRRIVRDQFQFEGMTEIPPLKGFDGPQVAWRLLGQNLRQGEARPASAEPVRLFGREAEMAELHQHWHAVRDNCKARAVLLSGEAGIGKTSLMRAFRTALESRNGRTLECRCTPEQVNTAFYPLVDLLGRRLRLAAADSSEVRLSLAAAALGDCPDQDRRAAALLDLLGTDTLLQGVAPERVRHWTLQALVQWVRHQTANGPVCLVVEDMHWVDPSTREFLKGLVAECHDVPLLLLMTRRVEGRDVVPLGVDALELALRGLASDQAEALIRTVVGTGPALAPELMATVIERADGVPLFIEESTRMMLDLKAQGDAEASADAVPGTLQDLLMARIDRMGPAKALAQLGSVLGREFTRALLAALAQRRDLPVAIGSVDAQLQRLLDGGLIGYKAGDAGGLYYFRHALTREAAYQSLWVRDRRQCHAVAADVLRQHFDGTVLAKPETLARHYELADQHADALIHWERAARVAMAHSAHAEATEHIEHALALAARLGDDNAAAERQLRLQVLLAGQLIATHGYGADRVGEVYAQALALCDRADDDRARFKILMGLEGYHFMRADFARAHRIVAQAQTLVPRLNDPLRTLQCHWALANILFHQGDLTHAVAHMDACLTEYHALPGPAPAVQDPGIMCLCYSALAQWELGHADDALRRAHDAIALADRLQHKFGQGEAAGFCSTLHYFRGEIPEALQQAERAIDICREGGFTVWLAHGRVMRGRCLAGLGDVVGGIAELQAGYNAWVRSGAQVTRPLYLSMLAEALALDGRTDAALAHLHEALAMAQRHGEGYYEAEILRLLGSISAEAAQRSDDARALDAAHGFLRQALHVAQTRRHAGLEARIRASLHRAAEISAS